MTIKAFRAIEPSDYPLIGPKAARLAEMYNAGLPVPDGFVAFPDCLAGGGLSEEGEQEAATLLSAVRSLAPLTRFAVRSSAMDEDGAASSMAGRYTSILGCNTNEEVFEAIAKVVSSGRPNLAYRASARGSMAVIVMALVEAEMAGVLFTADPNSGSHRLMSGNLSYGLSERLLSGEEDGMPFSLSYPSGAYTGPPEFKRYSRKLFRLAARLLKTSKWPLDIEFAARGGKVYIVQSRPITTLVAERLDVYEINDSLDGDMLWTSTNVGEAMTDVFSPFTFSLHRMLDEASPAVPGYYLVSGNILGRVYTNISKSLSIHAVTKAGFKIAVTQAKQYYGEMPEDMPIYPFSAGEHLRISLRLAASTAAANLRYSRKLAESLNALPIIAKDIAASIEEAKSPRELHELWNSALWPLMLRANGMLRFAVDKQIYRFMSIRPRLLYLVGQADANALLSISENESLASLGPLIGLGEVLSGAMTKEEYLERYGHRGAHEFDLSRADMTEDPSLLEERLASFEAEGFDIESLLERQKASYEDAAERLRASMPRKAGKVLKMVADASQGARKREKIRMEWTRAYRLARPFLLKAAEMLGLGDDIFLYYIDEVQSLLKGGEGVDERTLAKRRKNYEYYASLPELPAYIRGPYRPGAAAQPLQIAEGNAEGGEEVLTGFGGAYGVVTAPVRVLRSPEEASLLQAGEILVAPTTNIGWSVVFPKASAIVTDIGAPLSHATIIARELGIPAVVGCKSATAALKDGDIVTVDGGAGTVRIASAP